MSVATVIFALRPEMIIEAYYDDVTPPVPDQSHAGPRLNRAAAAYAGRREAEGPTIGRESAGTRQDGSRGPTISREDRE